MRESEKDLKIHPGSSSHETQHEAYNGPMTWRSTESVIGAGDVLDRSDLKAGSTHFHTWQIMAGSRSLLHTFDFKPPEHQPRKVR